MATVQCSRVGALASAAPLLLSVLLSACATFANKNAPVMVSVSTDPPGATVSFDGVLHRTPATVYLPRGKGDVQVTIVKGEYKTEKIVLKQAWDEWLFGNLLLGPWGLLGTIKDLREGAGYTLRPSLIQRKLVEDDSVESPLADLIRQISTNFKDQGVHRVAVLPVEDMLGKNRTLMARYFTEKLTMKMHGLGAISVIERVSLEKITDELVLTHEGGFREESIKRIGQFLGVDCIVTSVFVELDQRTVELNAKATLVETAQVIGIGRVLMETDRIPYVLQ